MEIVLLAVGTNGLAEFKKEMQRAFQKGYENTYGETEQVVLPEQDIDSSLDTEGAVAYKAVIGSKMVGDAVVVIDNKTQHNHLDLLFVKCGVQNRGIGAKIWSAIMCIFTSMYAVFTLFNTLLHRTHCRVNRKILSETGTKECLNSEGKCIDPP